MLAAVADGYFKGHLRIREGFTSAGTSHSRQFLQRRSLAFTGHLEAGRTSVAFLSPRELTVHVRGRLPPGPPPFSCTERHTGCQRPRSPQPRRQRPLTAARVAGSCPQPRSRSHAHRPGEGGGGEGGETGGLRPRRRLACEGRGG